MGALKKNAALSVLPALIISLAAPGYATRAIREKSLGPDHPDVASSLENLARLYRATERTREAEELEARAARIRSVER